MKTSFSQNLTDLAVKKKVSRFYDIGSPLYLKVYSSHIHDGYYITGKESREQAQENLIKLIITKAKIERGAKILDVGCGVGGSSVWLAKNLGAITTGITISPVQIKIASKLAGENQVNSSFLLMDADNMKFNETFDVIWVVAAMTHFIDQECFLKAATGILKKGGKVIIFDWMLGNNVDNVQNDRYIKPVTEGMLLSSINPLNSYLKWLAGYGYRVMFSEDITNHTIQTWDAALSLIKKPGVLKIAYKLKISELGEVLHFLKSIRAMRLAMRKEKIISGIIIAEKL